MKTLTTLSLCLALSLFSSLRVCNAALLPHTAQIFSSIITGTNKFDASFWRELNNTHTLEDMKSYETGAESVSLREDLREAFKYVLHDHKLSMKLDGFVIEMIMIEKTFINMAEHREIPLSHLSTTNRNETLASCLEILYADAKKLFNDTRNLWITLNADELVGNLNDSLQAYTKTCSREDSPQSIQTILYNFFTIIVAAEVKYFATLNIARDILNQNDVTNIVRYRMAYTNRLNALVKHHARVNSLFKWKLGDISRNFWRCEPTVYKEGLTHEKLNHVFQAYLRSEADIEKTDNPKIFRDTCSDPRTITMWTRSELCPRKCAGSLIDCEKNFEIRYSRSIDVCISKQGSDRTYDYVIERTGDTHTRGLVNNNCSNMVHITRGLFLPAGFDLYYCTCDDNLDYEKTKIHSDRKFYTGLVSADVENNFVITGLELHKENGVVCIHAQQGKLLPGGHINESSLEWIRVLPDEALVTENYYTIHWDVKDGGRDIELQDIDLPEGHVLVGLRFLEPSKNDLNHLRIEAYSRPLHMNLGKVVLKDSSNQDLLIVIGSSTTDFSKDHLETEGSKLLNHSLNYDTIVSNKSISFKKSDFETDFGQTTVPYLDIQSVTTKKPFPISGVGMYYRKNQDNRYAGFVGIKLKTYDFSRHLPL